MKLASVRLGDEAFALLLFDFSADETRQRAEALRHSLEAAGIATVAPLAPKC